MGTTDSKTSETKAEPKAAKTTGDVALVKARKQWLSTSVEIGGHKFVGAEPVLVPAADADELLEARDPDGRPYVERTKG